MVAEHYEGGLLSSRTGLAIGPPWWSAPTRQRAPSRGACGPWHLNYPDYEVLVVDDGSTDATAELASSYLRVISGGRLGLSGARNLGLEQAEGAIVAVPRRRRQGRRGLAHPPGGGPRCCGCGRRRRAEYTSSRTRRWPGA